MRYQKRNRSGQTIWVNTVAKAGPFDTINNNTKRLQYLYRFMHQCAWHDLIIATMHQLHRWIGGV